MLIVYTMNDDQSFGEWCIGRQLLVLATNPCGYRDRAVQSVIMAQNYRFPM